MRKITEEDTDIGRLIEIDDFVGQCVEGEITTSDGYGRLVYDLDDIDDKIEIDADDAINGNILRDENLTHVLWFDC